MKIKTFFYKKFGKIPFDRNRAIPKAANECCRTEGNLEWMKIERARYVGICHTCGRKHHILKVSEAKIKIKKPKAAGILMIMVLLFSSQGICQAVINHERLPDFDSLSPEQVQEAISQKIIFSNQSVGFYTSLALNCFAASSYGSSLPICRRVELPDGGTYLYSQSDHDSGVVPEYIDFNPDPVIYDRGNFFFGFTPNSDWKSIAKWIAEGIHSDSLYFHDSGITVHPSEYDAVSFQFSYLDIRSGSNILEWFSHLPGDYDDAYDLEREIRENLDPIGVKFIYWTTSLSVMDGTPEATDFNNRMRSWAIDNGRILFDFADIESHHEDGNPCFDPSGIYPAICDEKVKDPDPGHPSLAYGSVINAKAFYLMAVAASDYIHEPPPDPVEILINDLEIWFSENPGWTVYDLALYLMRR